MTWPYIDDTPKTRSEHERFYLIFNSKFMKIQKVLGTAFICMSLNSNAQISGFGIQPKIQFSTQTHHNPEKPKDGVSAEQGLTSYGIDAFLDYQLSDKWKLRIKSGIETKGYESRYHNSSSPEKVIDQYLFKYISMDAQSIYNFKSLGPITPTISAGLSTGYLFSKPENSWEYETFGEPFEHFDDFSSFCLGTTLGLGFHVNDIVWIDCEWNRDLIASIQRNNLVKRNRAYSINIGINVLKLVQELKK